MLIVEKVQQAVTILNELHLDAWLTFVRETTLTPDPALDLILGVDVTWPSAFLVTREGITLAIVGRFEVESVRATGAYQEIIGYDEDVRAPLLEALARFAPRSLVLNFSESNGAADGLTHGLYSLLQRYLRGTPYIARALSADALMSALRGRKTPAEVTRMRAAVATTLDLLASLTRTVLRPGITEYEIATWVQKDITMRGLTTAWGADHCPTVDAGPNAVVGHVAPGGRALERGHLLHLDVGVIENGYCSDLQRMWYCLAPGETRAPADVQRAFDVVREAIEAARAILRPGVAGWQVDAAARQVVLDASFTEYKHATGHHLGRAVHDGATVLGPRWARYGDTPYGLVEANNVFTLELGVFVPERGYLGLEEEVLVTEHGCEYLGPPQTELLCL